MTDEEFKAIALANPANAALLDRLPQLGLPQCFLVAGSLYQAVWNQRAGHAPDWGIKDYDIFYFDDTDLSWEAEDRVIRAAETLAADLGITVEPRNQARVHLWYASRFGEGYPQLVSSRDAIGRYLVTCTCIGIDAECGEVCAPYGFDELERGELRMNPVNARPEHFRPKAESYVARWPWLRIVD